jgi:2-hydroxy-6-oxo-6-(2'-aminophenyl)hexa-2,4-dienoate hydrolase
VNFTSKTAMAGGMETYYLEEGQGEPIVLIHGGGAGADAYSNWAGIIPMLAGHARVIAFDMLGFGRTAKPDGDFRYDQEARNNHLIAFLDALKLGKVTIVGNSMGGATAIGAAVKRPDLVKKLVLMGSAGLATEISPSLRTILHYNFTRQGMIDIIKALTNEHFVVEDKLIDYRMKNAEDPGHKRAYGETMRIVKEEGGLAYNEDFVRKVSVPTLVVNGKLDKVAPVALAYRFLELIPRSWGYIIPDCGHWAMIEHPEDFGSTTLNFVKHAH